MWAERAGFGETRRPGCATGVAAGARGLKVWKPLGLTRARHAGPARRRRRPAPGPAVGGGRRAGRPGHDPRRRPDRVLRAARRRQRALGGAARAPGLALLADPSAGPPRPAGLPAVRRDHRRPGGGGRAPSGDDLHRRPCRLRRRRTSGGSAGCWPRTRTGTWTWRPGSRSSGASRTRRATFFVRWPDRVLFGTDVAPGPGLVGGLLPLPRDPRRVVPLRARWTMDGGTPRRQGRWQIHGLGLPDDVLRSSTRRMRGG